MLSGEGEKMKAADELGFRGGDFFFGAGQGRTDRARLGTEVQMSNRFVTSRPVQRLGICERRGKAQKAEPKMYSYVQDNPTTLE